MWRVRAQNAQGATFVELFFDLVFVYAITQLTAFVIHDLGWGGVGRAALVFWLVWWAWTQFTWTLNLADTEHLYVRLPTLLASGLAFFLAQSIPDAFTTAGAWFALSYAIVRLIGLALQAWVIADDQRSSVSRWASSSMLGIGLVVLGGFADSELRVWLWLAAVVADLVMAGLAGQRVWVLEPAHFAERHGLIVIVALGESLVAAGVASAEIARGPSFAVTTSGALIATSALWWNYFGALHSRFEEVMGEQTPADLGRFARDVFSLWHAAVGAGVIGVAVAFEHAIAHSGDSLSPPAGVALTVGTALCVGGLAGAALRTGLRGAPVPRLVVALIALAATPVVSTVPASVALWALAILVITMDLVESRLRGSVATPGG